MQIRYNINFTSGMKHLIWKRYPLTGIPTAKQFVSITRAGGCDWGARFNAAGTAVNSITLKPSSSYSHPPLMSASEWRGEGRGEMRGER